MRAENIFRHYAKATITFTLTTTTYFIARATGMLPSWLSWGSMDEEGLNTIANLQTQMITKSGQRQLLQQAEVIVANSIPDQVIEVAQQYVYPLNNVFDGNYSFLDAVETGKSSLPGWLSLQYNLLSIYPAASAQGVAISGSTVFLANGIDLRILNVSNPSNPILLATFPAVNGSVYGVAINGSTVFVAEGSAGLQILDVSNLSNPVLLSTYPAGSFGSVQAVTINGSTAFVTDAGVGLQILDVSNTSNPRLLSSYLGAFQGSAVIRGATVFIACHNLFPPKSMQILDVSNTSNPRLLSTSPSGGGYSYGIALSGNTAFEADNSPALQIFDVSNTSNPRLISTYSLGPGGTAYGVTISGNTAFVANGVNLQIVDVSNTSNLRLISTYSSGSVGKAVGLAISGNTVFVTDSSAGLLILDISHASLLGVPPLALIGQQVGITVRAGNTSQELVTDSFTLTLDQLPRVVQSSVTDQSVYPGNSFTLLLSSELLFVNPGNSFLKLSVELSNGDAAPPWLNLNLLPIQLSVYPAGIGQLAKGVSISGGMAFVTKVFVAGGSAGLQILDVSTPSNPYLISTSQVQFGSVTINGSTALVADRYAGLQILDVSNPSNPRSLSNYSASSESVVIGGNTAFVANFVDLQILNVSNTSNPVGLAAHTAGSGGSAIVIAISGTTIFLGGANELRTFDVSNSSNPRLLSLYTSPYPSGGGSMVGIVIKGNAAFIADFNEGLQILDVSNASNPLLLASYPPGIIGAAEGVTVSGATAFVADGGAGLQILDVSHPSDPHLLGTYSAQGGYAYGVAISRSTAFLADGSAGLLILDISQWQLTASPGVADVGNYNLRLVATDEVGGSASTPFIIRVEGPPQMHGNISTQYAKVGRVFNYFIPHGVFSDPNFDPISFTAMLANNQSLPSWLNFNGISAAFSGTPQNQHVGNYTILLSATDNIAGVIATTFDLIVNHLPVVNQPLLNQVARIDTAYELIVPTTTFFDADGESLSYVAQSHNGFALPAWLNFNATTLRLTGFPTVNDAGSYDLQIVATDLTQGQAAAGFTLFVEYGPSVGQAIAEQFAGVGELYQFSLPSNSFIDLDGHALTYQAQQTNSLALPNWLVFNAIATIFSGVPLASNLGRMEIQLTVTDLYGGIVMQNFNLTVTYFPQAVLAIADQIAPIGFFYQFNVSRSTFVDLGGDTLIYSAQQSNGLVLPSWLHFNASLLQFFGVPNQTMASHTTVAVLATDSVGATARAEFDLFVENFPVVQQAIPPALAGVGIPLSLTIAGSSFLDLDGDPLLYAASRVGGSALPNWLTFDTRNRVFSGTPLTTDISVLSLLVSAADPSGGRAQQNFTLTIRYLPTVTQSIPPPSPIREGRVVNISIAPQTFADLSGATLYYRATQVDGSALPAWLSFNNGTLNFYGMPSSTDTGTFDLAVIADDAQGGVATALFALTITPNYPPTVTQPISTQVASVNQLFTLFVSPDTFIDLNNDPLTYSASQTDGLPLPHWLQFDASTISFSGMPSRSDTGAFSQKVIPVRLTAADDQSQRSTSFNLNVQGTSNIALFLQIGAPLLTILTGAFAAYQQRAYFLNRCRKTRYEKIEQRVTVGDTYEYKFETAPGLVKKVRAKNVRNLNCCCRFFKSPRQRVAGGGDMPSWLEYDTDTNAIRSIGPIPAESPSQLIVQVKDDEGIVLEQFTLRIDAVTESLPELEAMVDIDDAQRSIEMQTLSM